MGCSLLNAYNSADKIDIFFGEKSDNGINRGVSLIDVQAAVLGDASHVRTVFIVKEKLRPHTLAHEIGHVLTDRGHYVGKMIPNGIYDYPDLNNNFPALNIATQNLMRNGTSMDNGVFGSKRLWIFQLWDIYLNTNLLHY